MSFVLPSVFTRLLPLLTSLGLVSVLSGPGSAHAAESAPEPPSASSAGAATALVAPAISCLGQTFLLAQSSGTPLVETHEYTREGETLRNWSQLVTVQRLTLARTTTAAEFVAFSQQRLGREGGTTVLTQPSGPRTGLFTAHFPQTADQEEQVVVCLVLAPPTAPAHLDIIQYAAKPTRLTPEQLEIQLRAWRGRLQSQAQQAEKAR